MPCSRISNSIGTAFAAYPLMLQRKPKIYGSAAQFRRVAKRPAKAELSRSRRALAAWCGLFAASSVFSICRTPAFGEEAASRGQAAKGPLLLAYAAPSPRVAFAQPASITGAASKQKVEPEAFDRQQHEVALSSARSLLESSISDDGKQVESLLQGMSGPRARRDGDMALQFLHKKMPSRFAYDSWTGVETGYGQFLADNALGRSRTSGAGVQDPDWLYLKMSFKF